MRSRLYAVMPKLHPANAMGDPNRTPLRAELRWLAAFALLAAAATALALWALLPWLRQSLLKT